MNPDDFQAVQEALRRRMGQLPSAAGISGGAPAANANVPGNPIAAMAANGLQQVGATTIMPQPGTVGNQTAGAQDMLKKAAPGEAEMIIKSLTKRLEQLPPSNV